MKKKHTLPLLIVCAVLAVALVVSLLMLGSARKDAAELEAQILKLTKENDELDNLNQALRLQLDSLYLGGSANPYFEEAYCALLVDEWTAEDGTLQFDAFAQVFLTAPAAFSARLELWKGDAVYSSQPVTLNATEADTVFEANLSTSFRIPELSSGEELQLWLMVEPEGSDALFACAAGWYLENGELMIITG